MTSALMITAAAVLGLEALRAHRQLSRPYDPSI
jgi:hypothetical protein